MKNQNLTIPKVLTNMPRDGIQGYTEEQHSQKVAFHAGAKKLLKDVAKELGLIPSDYRLTTNMAGPAVCGETVLHTESLYLILQDSFSDRGAAQIMYRTVTSRTDYQGGTNNFINVDHLCDESKLENWLAALKKISIPQSTVEPPSVAYRRSPVFG